MTAAYDVVNSTTPYFYDSQTQTFMQPALAAQLLRQLQTVNSRHLKSLKFSEEISFDSRLPLRTGSSFKDMVDIGTKDETLAPLALSAVLDALGKQDQ